MFLEKGYYMEANTSNIVNKMVKGCGRCPKKKANNTSNSVHVRNLLQTS